MYDGLMEQRLTVKVKVILMTVRPVLMRIILDTILQNRFAKIAERLTPEMVIQATVLIIMCMV